MATSKMPMPVFYFKVQFGADDVTFSEVSGLTMENQVIEYRGGDDPVLSAAKMPGIPKFANISLKRGMMKSDNSFFNWFNTTALNEIERRDLSISMLNPDGDPVVTWKVTRAWPVKVEGPGLKAAGNEVAIETIELAHEGLKVEMA